MPDTDDAPLPGAAEPLGMVDALVQLSFAVHATLGAAAARHDLTLGQVRLLGILRDREPGMRELADHLGLDKSSVTGLIDRAERRGLVRRSRSPQDGRGVRVASTQLGQDLARRAGDEIASDLADLTGALDGAGRRQLAILVARIVERP